MSKKQNFLTHLATALICALGLLNFQASNATTDYANALKDVGQIKAIFDVSQKSAKISNLVFWAVQNTYQDGTVSGLAKSPEVAVVFHGPVVKLLSTDRSQYKPEDVAEVDKFHATLRQMKADGVKLEVCQYALKVLKVDPTTVIAEIDQVPNGFVSILGYQAQGYDLVRIP
jgi:intracellular sulfur oxidation DsrE/DsrF family protein